ncbi:MAG TPA: 2-amino-4-hydroxy-6-hydroxymethyldihydropteridine diphosphokinase [Chthoniobacterales bacterium]|nr:2-amino-4-hydroxy-6-hydroxymethyldihydropteridine diphosphokinase [Chthoniobacterales bacterium]
MRAGVALGSNLGDRLAQLQSAREQLFSLPGAEPAFLVSAVYETEPVDCEENATNFLNAVVEIGYGGEAETLLSELRQIEATLGRPVRHARNASRTIDLDLLYFGEVTRTSAELQLPHPRLHERRFVLEPLHDIRPDLILPGQHETVTALLQELPETPPLLRVASEW